MRPAESLRLKAGIRALLHLWNNHRREGSGELDYQGFGSQISGNVSTLVKGFLESFLQPQWATYYLLLIVKPEFVVLWGLKDACNDKTRCLVACQARTCSQSSIPRPHMLLEGCDVIALGGNSGEIDARIDDSRVSVALHHGSLKSQRS